jgi:hypothetical protein
MATVASSGSMACPVGRWRFEHPLQIEQEGVDEFVQRRGGRGLGARRRVAGAGRRVHINGPALA